MSEKESTVGLILVKVSFDSMENHIAAAVHKQRIRTFVDDKELTAHGKAARFIESLEPERRYLGYDGNVYPLYELERTIVE